MPETINLTNRPYFAQGVSFSDLTIMAVGITYTTSEDPMGEVELHDMILPELKLTRQHGKYFDREDDCGDRELSLSFHN